jgi:tetratricopeptide (TPR) repeat protein
MNRPEDPMAAWLRGELSAEEERELRAAAGPESAAEIERYDRALAELRALPREIEPESDLYPGIAARLARARRRTWPLVAAATLLLLAGLALMLRLQNPGRTPDIATAEQASSPAAKPLPGASAISRTAYADTDRALAEIRRELRRTIDERKDEMPPETRELVFQNLRIIEQAIADIETALDAAPADPDLARTYIAYRERQIALLRQVNRMAAKL